MSIQKYQKIHKPTKFTQLVLIDLDGYLKESCDTIFPSQSLRSVPLLKKMPFLESIFEVLIELKVGAPEIRFSKVEQPASFLPGYYDFTFSKIHLEDRKGILWCIFDYTDLYIQLMDYQQQHNELEIHRQLFELENQRIQYTSDIAKRKYLFETHFKRVSNHSFYAKVQEIIHAQENPLGIFSILKKQDNLSVLEDLQQTIDEFSIIKEDYEVYLKSQIKAINKPSFIQFHKLTKQVHEVIEKKLGRSVSLKINLSSLENSSQKIIADRELIVQTLFHLLLPFYEQSPVAKIIITAFSKKDSSKKNLLNICITQVDISSDNRSIKEPTSLLLRLSLVKKLLQNSYACIAATYHFEQTLDINIHIPCQTID